VEGGGNCLPDCVRGGGIFGVLDAISKAEVVPKPNMYMK